MDQNHREINIRLCVAGDHPGPDSGERRRAAECCRDVLCKQHPTQVGWRPRGRAVNSPIGRPDLTE